MSDAALRRLDLADPAWASFVADRPEATIFHHPAWASVLARSYGGLSPFVLVLERDGGIAQGLPFGPCFSLAPRVRRLAMTLRVFCPCGRKLKVRAELAGQRVRCPSCRRPLTAPQEDPVLEEPVPPRPLPSPLWPVRLSLVWLAVGLFVGTFVVSLVDNFLRPFLIGRETKLPVLWLLLALIGGLRTFGFLGLLLGPIILSLFLACYRIYTEGPRVETAMRARRPPAEPAASVPR